MHDTRQALLSKECNLTSRLCSVIGSPRALMIRTLIQNREWEQLAEVETDPSEYHTKSVSEFAADYLVSEIMRKSQVLPINRDLVKEAKAAFYAAEKACAITNGRLYGNRKPSWFFDYQRIVQEVMGPLRPAVLNKIAEGARFGPGASTGVSGQNLVQSVKYKSKGLHLTRNLVPFVRALMGETWWDYHRGSFVVVSGNKYGTVAKKATQRRGTCSEPDLNVFCQLGIGEYLVSRLKLFGVDLSDQGANQSLVRLAYELGLATIDMTQASDLMARATVSETVTYEWDHLLEIARSPCTYIDGTFVELAKHSSMGNGYTFPLQSVIFLGVVRATVPRHLWCLCGVYGDDLIVPQEFAQVVVDRLEYLGFQVNGKKTHLAGEFFESCGVDTFRGVDVRPIYCRQEPGDPVPFEVHMANQLRLYASRVWGGDVCDSRWRPVWEDLVKAVPKKWDVRVPAHFGDTGIICSLSEAQPARASQPGVEKFRGWEGWLVKYVKVRTRRVKSTRYGLVLRKLARTYSTMPPGAMSHRQRELAATRHIWLVPERRTYGFESVKGQIVGCATRKTVTEWPPGLDWA